MVDIVEQLCVRSFEITAENGDHWKAEQGETYTTTIPDDEKDTVVVFSRFWVPIPKGHFIIREKTK